MGITTKYVLDKIVLPSGTVLSELDQLEINTNVQQIVERGSGVPHAQFAAAMGVLPEYTFECKQIKAILSECGATAKSLAGGNTDLYFKKATYAGTRELAATTVHKRFRMTTGMLCWTQIQASQNQVAKAVCRLIAGYDGTNLPLTELGTLALSGTNVNGLIHTLGASYIGAQVFRGLTDLVIDSGLDIYQEQADGEIYPSWLGIKEGNPSIMLTGPDLEQVEDLEFEGQSSGTVVSYLRRKQASNHNYANASLQHISFTMAAGMAVLETIRGGGNEGAVSGVKITGVSTSETTWPLVVASDVAHP